MPNHLSLLGIVHTVVSILALVYAFIALVRDGKIDPRNGFGKGYVVLTALTCLTSFGVRKTGHFTPAHGLSILVLMILLIAIYARSIRLFGTAGEKIGIVAMSLTLFFSFIPAITETLTRLPIEHPIAASPDASVIKMSFLLLIVVFALLLFYQLHRFRKIRLV